MIITLIGARPQFVKAAVVSKAFIEKGIPETIVHSGQHYDERMSQIFWEELGIPQPLYNLNIGSGSHAVQTAGMMTGLESIINNLNETPKAILLYGDTNTTVAGSLLASKLHMPAIHIEAGLRRFNRTMPEEINRVVTDHLSDLLFCPSEGMSLRRTGSLSTAEGGVWPSAGSASNRPARRPRCLPCMMSPPRPLGYRYAARTGRTSWHLAKDTWPLSENSPPVRPPATSLSTD